MKTLRKALAGIAILCVGLTSLAVQPAAAEGFSEEKQAEIESIIRNYLLENPEVLREVIEALHVKETAQQERKDREAIGKLRAALDGGNPAFIGGNPNGDVTLIEFFDYTCGYCRGALADIERLSKTDDNLRIVYKEFPVLGPVALYASLAAIASTKQGKYLEFHSRLMGSKTKLNEGLVLKIAEDIGLDIDQLKKNMDDPDTIALIESNHSLASSLGISGTPNFVIGDRIVQGAKGYDFLRTAIEDARKDCQTC